MFKRFFPVIGLFLSFFFCTQSAFAVKKIYLGSHGLFLNYLLNPDLLSDVKLRFDPYRKSKTILILGDSFEDDKERDEVSAELDHCGVCRLKAHRVKNPPRSLLRPSGLVLKKRTFSDYWSSESESESESEEGSESDRSCEDPQETTSSQQNGYVSLAETVANIASSKAKIFKTGFECPKSLDGKNKKNIFYSFVDHRETLPFEDSSYDTIILRRGICYCFKNENQVSDETCAGINLTSPAGRKFFLDVVRVLNKKNPNSIAFLHGFYFASDEGKDFLLPTEPHFAVLLEKEKAALVELEQITNEIEKLFPDLEVSLIHVNRRLDPGYKWNVHAADQPHVDRRERLVPALIGVIIRPKGRMPIESIIQ